MKMEGTGWIRMTVGAQIPGHCNISYIGGRQSWNEWLARLTDGKETDKMDAKRQKTGDIRNQRNGNEDMAGKLLR
jgi:hypothetical protein